MSVQHEGMFQSYGLACVRFMMQYQILYIVSRLFSAKWHYQICSLIGNLIIVNYSHPLLTLSVNQSLVVIFDYLALPNCFKFFNCPFIFFLSFITTVLCPFYDFRLPLYYFQFYLCDYGCSMFTFYVLL